MLERDEIRNGCCLLWERTRLEEDRFLRNMEDMVGGELLQELEGATGYQVECVL